VSTESHIPTSAIRRFGILRNIAFAIVAHVSVIHVPVASGQNPVAESAAPSLDELPSTAESSPDLSAQSIEQPVPQQGIDFIRGIILLLIPRTFEDSDDWGRETRIQSGLKIDFDDGRLKTKRRWKLVNHGSWLQGSGELLTPEESLQLNATLLSSADSSARRYRIQTSATLRVTGRQQQWNYGVRLWSISADAIAKVRLEADIEVLTQIVNSDAGPRLRFLPKITRAKAKLDDFSLRRISHFKGTGIREMGDVLKELIDLRIRKENRDLAHRINKALQRKPERLEIPLTPAFWFSDAPGEKATSTPATESESTSNAN
jgi:hypothetical protein